MFSNPFGNNFTFVALSSQSRQYSKLQPEELALLSPFATEKRKTEFQLGRAAAHKALFELGFQEVSLIGKGERGEPLWPEGIVGSITHSRGWAIVVAARECHAKGIGIDLQEIRRTDPGVCRRICHDSELAWLDLEPSVRTIRLTKIFSAKESIYKAFYPLCKQYMAFKDVELSWDESSESFHGVLLKDLIEEFPKGYRFEVGVQVKGKFVFTYLAL